ncbi:MAG TPA: hypothetical protein VF727_10735 [Allosphingosinicella sp.]|jgi:hypothetical protein
MKSLLLVALLTAASASSAPAEDGGKTFLLSIGGISLRPHERVERFAIATWGVDYLALCSMPGDWEMQAGSSGPGGRLAGQASHGTSYIGNLEALRNLALVRLTGRVQERDNAVPGGLIPATFSGSLGVSGGTTEARTLKLDHRRVRLTPATQCPAPRL